MNWEWIKRIGAAEAPPRPWAVLLALYVIGLLVYLPTAGWQRISEHTPYNHFSVLADAWLHGQLDLPGDPPDYAQGNDFARYGGRWYITFPALPALLIAPLVWFSGSVERVRDGQFFIWLAPIGPCVFYLVLERLRALGLSRLGWIQNVGLWATLAFGTVYYFTAVQGTVWFAAHVVAMACSAGFLLFSLGADRPLLAGLFLGLSFWARAPTLLCGVFFVMETLRTNLEASSGGGGSWLRRLQTRRLVLTLSQFAVPIVLLLGLACLHNYARFDNPFDFGYRHLQIAWRDRIEKWGLFHYHYLAKNLGVILTSLPWVKPFRVNVHGLALWLTTPVYLLLLFPARATVMRKLLLGTALCVALPSLLYQNTGWQQFGYRFSNDYSLFLLAALAVGVRRLGKRFWGAVLVGVVINTFGAVTFGKPQYQRYYYQQSSQKLLYQPS